MTVHRRLIPLALLALASIACSNSTSQSDKPQSDGDGRIDVVTTVSPITNIASNIGGDRVRVDGIVPEGENSHEFNPRPSDAKFMAKADIIFVNGLHLESPTIELAKANKRSKVKIVALGEQTITPDQYIYDFSFPKKNGDPNPHLWTHPLHALTYARIIRDDLTALDADGASTYAKNYEAFAARINALDAAIVKATATVPAKNRKLLTYHDSFPYFAKHYGWTIIGAVQPADFAEPKPREVADLIRQIQAQKVPAIFGSEVFSSSVLEQIAKSSGARYVDRLRDDDLPGKAGEATHSYLSLMVFDFTTFMKALGGDVSAFASVDTTNVVPETNATYRE